MISCTAREAFLNVFSRLQSLYRSMKRAREESELEMLMQKYVEAVGPQSKRNCDACGKLPGAIEMNGYSQKQEAAIFACARVADCNSRASSWRTYASCSRWGDVTDDHD